MTGLTPFSPVSDAAAIGIGAICGALCRHQIGKIATEHINKNEKLKYFNGWHTAGINIIGSFILGGIGSAPLVNEKKKIIQQVPGPTGTITAVQKSSSSNEFKNMITNGMTPRMKLLLGVGFCGSFTTFSTFSVDLVNMIGRGEITRACSYLMVNNIGGVVAAASGMMLMKNMLRKS